MGQNMGQSMGLTVAVGCWAVALSTLVCGVIDQSTVALDVAVFLAVGATAPTQVAIASYMVRRHAVTVEQVIDTVDALHEGHQDIRHLR
jgi:hypothetical protein